MKPSSLAPAFLAATLFLLPALPAQEASDEMDDAAEKSSNPQSSDRHTEIMKRFDKNGDGKLDEDEKAAAKEANREETMGRQAKVRERLSKRALEKFDKDGDGKLNEAEHAEAVKAMENNPRLVQRFDKDSDGKLNDAEKAAAREALMERSGKRADKSKSD